MALEMRSKCERCDKALVPESDQARICSYECTFCADCSDGMNGPLPELRWGASAHGHGEKREPADARR